MGAAPNLNVLFQQTNRLQLRNRQPRKHSDRQIAQLMASIRQFGFVNPILVDGNNRVVAGYGRLLAARKLGLASVPTICLEHLSEAELRAYALADNRLAELSGWDDELLRLELSELLELDLDFSIEVTGFVTAEIDRLLDVSFGEHSADPADEVEPPAERAVSKLGDLWQLGRHRLLCANALEELSYQSLLGEERAQMVFTDPPYNVKVNGHVSGLGRARHREFLMASGEMSEEQFTSFLMTICQHLVRHTVDGSIHDICMDWRHLGELLAAGRAAYSELKNLCVWVKDSGGMGSFYRSRHEMVLVFKNGTAPHINNFGLGESGRYRTNCWEYPGVNGFRSGREDELAMHPTVKPVALVADAIRDCSRRKGLILDPFCGSGTTIIAAERTDRSARCLELDPRYVDVAVRRWQTLTGLEARLPASDKTFAETAAARAAVEAAHV